MIIHVLDQINAGRPVAIIIKESLAAKGVDLQLKPVNIIEIITIVMKRNTIEEGITVLNLGE